MRGRDLKKILLLTDTLHPDTFSFKSESDCLESTAAVGLVPCGDFQRLPFHLWAQILTPLQLTPRHSQNGPLWLHQMHLLPPRPWCPCAAWLTPPPWTVPGPCVDPCELPGQRPWSQVTSQMPLSPWARGLAHYASRAPSLPGAQQLLLCGGLIG